MLSTPERRRARRRPTSTGQLVAMRELLPELQFMRVRRSERRSRRCDSSQQCMTRPFCSAHSLVLRQSAGLLVQARPRSRRRGLARREDRAQIVSPGCGRPLGRIERVKTRRSPPSASVKRIDARARGGGGLLVTSTTTAWPAVAVAPDVRAPAAGAHERDDQQQQRRAAAAAAATIGEFRAATAAASRAVGPVASGRPGRRGSSDRSL